MTPVISISQTERAQRQEDLRATLGHLRLEGLKLSPEAIALFKQHADGEISWEELEAAIDELNDREFGPVHVSRH